MRLLNDDTIYAPATVPGTGAISIVRVSGAEALAVADKVIRCRRGKIADAKGYTLLFGTVQAKDGKVLDEVLVSVFRAPHSYTGENSVEISCHASSYIVGEIMSMLAEAGARAAAPGEFTQRAFLNGKMDLAQAEAVADVIASQNSTAHRVAFSQMKGGFSSELKAMRSELLEMVSLMELELDFSEEDVEFADRSRLVSLLDRTISHIGRLSASFRLGNAIKNGVPVAIVGATNAGKSTLLNALLGEERAIVSDIHGTTRDTIEETLNIDGVLFRFIDTAGLRETEDAVEKIGIERSYSKLHSAQIVLGVLDGSLPEDDIVRSAEEIVSQVNFAEQRLWLLVNKCDSADKYAENLRSETNGIARAELTADCVGPVQSEIPMSGNAGIMGTEQDVNMKPKPAENLRSETNGIARAELTVEYAGPAQSEIPMSGNAGIMGTEQDVRMKPKPAVNLRSETDGIARAELTAEFLGQVQSETQMSGKAGIMGTEQDVRMKPKPAENLRSGTNGIVRAELTVEYAGPAQSEIPMSGNAGIMGTEQDVCMEPKPAENLRSQTDGIARAELTDECCDEGAGSESCKSAREKSDNIDIQANKQVANTFTNKFVIKLNNVVSHFDSKQITTIGISARTGQGLDTLRSGLAASQKDIFSCQDTTLVTNQRHYDALISASASLSRVKSGLTSGIPTDLAAQDIREALYTLGTIVGEISTDEVLGNIFRNFCIGK